MMGHAYFTVHDPLRHTLSSGKSRKPSVVRDILGHHFYFAKAFCNA